MASVTELVPVVGVPMACEAVGVARASFYRQTRQHGRSWAGRSAPSPRRPEEPREGAAGERSELTGDRFRGSTRIQWRLDASRRRRHPYWRQMTLLEC